MTTTTHPKVRRWWIVLVTTAAIAALAAGPLVFLSPGERPGPRTYDVQPVAAINPSSSTIGIADPYLYGKTQTEIDKTLDTMLSLGVRDIRVMVPWAGIEATKGKYNWAAMDRVVNAAASRGMGVLGFINSTPYWAATNKIAISGQPDPNVYATFAGKVAERYTGKISAYEVWNEPNAYKYFSPIDATKYTKMLQAAYTTIKAKDPTATVIGGVVGAGLSFGGLTLSPVTFVDSMYKAGAKGFFDALSFHPYHYTLKFSAGKTVINSPYKQLEALRQLMVTNGDDGKLIWNTEYGIPSNLAGGEANQASYIQDMLTTWKNLNYVGPVFIFTTRDLKSGSTKNIDNFGIFKLNWTPKLVAEVIRQQIISNAKTQLTSMSTATATTLKSFNESASNQLQKLNQAVADTLKDLQTSVSNALSGNKTAAAANTSSKVASAQATSATPAVAAATGDTPKKVDEPKAVATTTDPSDDKTDTPTATSTGSTTGGTTSNTGGTTSNTGGTTSNTGGTTSNTDGPTVATPQHVTTSASNNSSDAAAGATSGSATGGTTGTDGAGDGGDGNGDGGN